MRLVDMANVDLLRDFGIAQGTGKAVSQGCIIGYQPLFDDIEYQFCLLEKLLGWKARELNFLFQNTVVLTLLL